MNLNDLLKQFLKNHDVSETDQCRHGCGVEHKAYKYAIIEDWGFVFYDCPKAIGKKKHHKAFPLSKQEREEIKEMYWTIRNETEPQ